MARRRQAPRDVSFPYTHRTTRVSSIAALQLLPVVTGVGLAGVYDLQWLFAGARLSTHPPPGAEKALYNVARYGELVNGYA